MAVELISAAAIAANVTGNGPSPSEGTMRSGFAAAINSVGLYIAFTSNATDLVPGLSFSGTGDLFLRNRLTNTTRCVSVHPTTGIPLGNVGEFAIAGTGSVVAFTTDAPVYAGDPPGSSDVLVYDSVAGTTAVVTVAHHGGAADGDSIVAGVSGSGRFIVYSSEATNLVPGGKASPNIYRYDRETGTTVFVDGYQGSRIDLSSGGNVAAFVVSDATGGPDKANVYTHDFTTGVTAVASAKPDGSPADALSSSDLDFDLSGDGLKVAFSTSVRMTPHDLNDETDVYVRDLAAATTTLVSAGPDGNSNSRWGAGHPRISGTGRHVVFESFSKLTSQADLDPARPSGRDVFVSDLQNGEVRLVSADRTGAFELGGHSPQITAFGDFVLYFSDNPGAIFGDTPGVMTRVVVRELATGIAAVLNRRPDGTVFDLGPAFAFDAAISYAGRAVALSAGAGPVGTTWVDGVSDMNDAGDVVVVPYAPDTKPPYATVGPLPPLRERAAYYDFHITWVEDGWMDPASVSTGDVVITGPRGFRQPAVLLYATPMPNSNRIVARYRFASPAGIFDQGLNARYAIEAAEGEVWDAGGNATAGPVDGGMILIGIPAVDGPDLRVQSFEGAVPANVIGGARRKPRALRVTVINDGPRSAVGSVTVRVVASTDGFADASDPIVAELPGQELTLGHRESKVFKLRVGAFPAALDGDYRLLAVVDPGDVMPERIESNNTATHDTTIRIAAPFVDLGVSAPSLTGRLAPGKKASLAVTLRNDGNQPAATVTPLRVRLTTDPANPAAVARVIDVPLKLKLKPGASRLVRAKLTLPADMPPGAYFVVTELLAADPDPSDNTATSASPVTV
jgi:hypothetical protein